LIVLFTDFGEGSPYSAEVRAVLERQAPGIPVLSLLAGAPACDPQAAAYLLAAYASGLPAGTVVVAVVDPGVGGERPACVVEADRRWYVGPGNGLFDPIIRRAGRPARAWRIDWRPARMSQTFHGRDLFAPVAARLARGAARLGPPLDVATIRRPEWPDDLPRVVYVDGYGNAMSGLRASLVPASAHVLVGGRRIASAPTFSAVPDGEPFWYENSCGLLEIAVNRRRAVDVLGVAVGTPLGIEV
jgi:S-adenosyl-L-methionine hydrolase (adenosine-forming)